MTEAQQLKRLAIEGLTEAREIILHAAHNLQNLEGPAPDDSYDTQYQATLKLYDDLNERIGKIESMPDATGVFKP